MNFHLAESDFPFGFKCFLKMVNIHLKLDHNCEKMYLKQSGFAAGWRIYERKERRKTTAFVSL